MFSEGVGYPVAISRHSARASLRGNHVYWYECAAFHGASQHRKPVQIGKEGKACYGSVDAQIFDAPGMLTCRHSPNP